MSNTDIRQFVARRTINGEVFEARVSPCCWMHHGYPLQITVTAVGCPDMLTTVSRRDKVLATATELDIQALLDEMPHGICKCGKVAIRFQGEPNAVRPPRCEQCHAEHGRKEWQAIAAKRAERRKQQDRQSKAEGYTHRVEAWIHPENDDDVCVVFYGRNPTAESVANELKRLGSTDTSDFVIVPL